MARATAMMTADSGGNKKKKTDNVTKTNSSGSSQTKKTNTSKYTSSNKSTTATPKTSNALDSVKTTSNKTKTVKNKTYTSNAKDSVDKTNKTSKTNKTNKSTYQSAYSQTMSSLNNKKQNKETKIEKPNQKETKTKDTTVRAYTDTGTGNKTNKQELNNKAKDVNNSNNNSQVNNNSKEKVVYDVENNNNDGWSFKKANQRIEDLKKTSADFENGDAYERHLAENKISFSSGDALNYFQNKAKQNGTTAREEAQASRTKWNNILDTEELETKYKNGELTDDDVSNINNSFGALIDSNGNKVDTEQYQKDIETYQKNSDNINKDIEKLNNQFENNLISQENYQLMYNNLESKWNQNQELGDALQSVSSVQGFDYYNWAKEHGEDVSDFEKYAESFNDSYVERLGEQYSASLVDLINTPVQVVDMAKSLIDKDFDITDENNLSTKLSNQSNELRTYAMAGTSGVENWSLQCISSLMPMMNAMLLGNAVGGVLGATGEALTDTANAFTNITLGAQNAGQVARQRVMEGNNNVTAVLNGTVHGVITGLVEGLDAGRVASVFTGTAEKYLAKMSLLGKANPKLIAQFLNSMGASEGAEEIIESVTDYFADTIHNDIASALSGDTSSLVNVEKLDAKDLVNQFAMAYVGSVGLGLPTATKITINSKRVYNAVNEAKNFFQSTIESSLATQEEKALAQECIDVINHDMQEYDRKAVLKDAVNRQSDNVGSYGTFDEAMNNLANALRPDIQDATSTARQTMEKATQLKDTMQNALLQKGININSDQYMNLSENARDQVKAISSYAQEGLGNLDVVFDTSLETNGEYSIQDGKPTLVINPNSEVAPVVTFIHESMHSIENTGEYAKLADLAYSDKSELQRDVNKLLKGDYKGHNISDVRIEAINNKVSAQLINDPVTFIDNLTKYNTDIAYKFLYDIKSVINDHFSNNNQLNQIESLLTKGLSRSDVVYSRNGTSYSKDILSDEQINEVLEGGDISKQVGNVDFIVDNLNLKEGLYQKYTIGEVEKTSSSSKILYDGYNTSIDEFVENTLKGDYNNSKDYKTLYIAKISNELSNEINNKAGNLNYDLTNYNLVLDSTNVQHIENEHGVNANENLRGQIPVDADDFKLLPYLVAEADSVQTSIGKNGELAIDFIKNIDDGTYTVVEFVRKGRHNLALQTMYINQLNVLNEKNSHNVTNELSSLVSTSKTVSDMSSYKDIISNDNGNVKFSKGNPTIDNIESLKQAQSDIIQETNPRDTTLGNHLWIDSANDVKTFEETLLEENEIVTTPDFDETDIQKALETGKMMVYSSYPIEQGNWVTPSKMEASQYAGGGKIYSKEVNLTDVAWAYNLEGQYANVNEWAMTNKDLTQSFNNDINLSEEGLNEVELNDFRRIQETSGRLSEEQSKAFHKGNNGLNEGIRRGLSRLFRGRLQTERGKLWNNSTSLINPETNTNIELLENVDGKAFHDIFSTVQQYLKWGDAVDVHDDYSNTKNYLSSDGLSGFAIEEDGNLVSVFNLGNKGFLKTIKDYISQNGATKLDCYESEVQPLAGIYTKTIGWKTASILDFNYDMLVEDKGKEYADYFVSTYGESPVAFMVNTNEDIETKHFNMNSYDEAVAYRDSFLNNSSEYYDYGMNPAREIDIKKYTDKGMTMKGARTLANSNWLTEEQALDLQKRANKGDFAYSKDSNQEQYNRAIQYIKKNGWQNTIERALTKPENWKFGDALDTMVTGSMALSYLAQNGEGNSEIAHQLESNIIYATHTFGTQLQSVQIFKNITPQGQIVTIRDEVARMQEGLNKRYGNGATQLVLDEELLQQYLESFDNEKLHNEIGSKIQQSIADQLPTTFAERLNAFRHLAMLSNPKTSIKNFLGNGIWGKVTGFKRTVQTGLEYMMTLTKEDSMFHVNERNAGIYNPFNASEKALYDALKQEYKDNYSDFKGKYTNGDIGNIIASDEWGQGVEDKRATFGKSKVGQFLNKWEELNGKMLSDTPAMSSAYAKFYIGKLKSNGWDIKNLTSEQKAQISEYAFEQARIQTFNETNEVANILSRLSNKGTGWQMVVDSFIPFKRTPMNVVKEGVRYSPIGLANTITRGMYQLKNGTISANQFADNLASGLTGSGIVLLGVLLSKLGLFRTTDDDKDKKQYFDEDNGEQDYAIVTPFGTYTIDWMDPLIMPLAMGAELGEVFAGEENTIEALVDVAGSIADPIFETSMLSGFENILGTNNGKKWYVNLVENIASTYVQQYVPSISGAVARTIDDTRRTTYPNNGFIDKTVKKIANKIPGLSTTLEPYINKQGEEEKNEDLGLGILGRGILQLVSPGYYSSNDVDEYDEELYRLYGETGELGVFPSDTSASTTYANESYKLTSKEYTEWNKTRLSLEKQYVDEFIDSKNYEDFDDSQKASIIEKIRAYAGDVAKDEFLTSRGIEYDDSSYQSAKEAMDNDIDLYQFYETTEYYSGLTSDDKKNEYIAYLEDMDTTDTGRNYMYDKYYGNSKLSEVVNEMDISDGDKFNIKKTSAIESLKDGDGNTIKNSKALAVADSLADDGVLETVFDYIKKHGYSASDFGLNKTVAGYSYSTLAKKYKAMYGEEFGTGETLNLGTGTGTGTGTRKYSSSKKKSSSSKSSKTVTTEESIKDGLSADKTSRLSTKASTTNSNGSSKASLSSPYLSYSNGSTSANAGYSNYDKAYASVMSNNASNLQARRNYGQSTSQNSSSSTTYCDNCGNVVTPINGRCPVCGANL